MNKLQKLIREEVKSVLAERVRMIDILSKFSKKIDDKRLEGNEFSKYILAISSKEIERFRMFEKDIVIVDTSFEDVKNNVDKYFRDNPVGDEYETDEYNSAGWHYRTNEAICLATDKFVEPYQTGYKGIFFSYIKDENIYIVYNNTPEYVAEEYFYVYEKDVQIFPATSILDKTYKVLKKDISSWDNAYSAHRYDHIQGTND